MKNVMASQADLLTRLRERDPGLAVGWDDVRGVARSLRGVLAPARAGTAPDETVAEFLEAWGDLLGPPALTRALLPPRRRHDPLGWTHLEFQQAHGASGAAGRKAPALEVYGAKLAAHVDPGGALTAVESSCWRDVAVDVRPQVTARKLRDTLAAAAAVAEDYAALAERMRKEKHPTFPVMDAPRLVVYPWQGRFVLAWTATAYAAVTVADDPRRTAAVQRLDLGQVFVDAHTGERFLFLPFTMHAEVAAAGTGLSVTPLGRPYAP